MNKNIFIPGRLCIMGEHSDWAAGHRRQNSDINKGYAIIVPTNEGNYAHVKKTNQKCLTYIKNNHKINLPYNLKKLKKIAEEGKFFSYIAGVLYQILSSYNNISGLEINNYKSSIPLKKGLSSSASVCVLITRAYNKAFGLNWTIKREMEIAYLGETTTPSRCGKLDQACAFSCPVLIEFDGDSIELNPINITTPIYMIIVDLHSNKDTKKILSKLNIGFPFPSNMLEKKKHMYFNKINKDNVFTAKKYIETGDIKNLGKILNKSQKDFDRYLAPSCPEELTAPKLHKIIQSPLIKEKILGAKGVGSQGDGTAQILVNSIKHQEEVISILEANYDVSCIKLTVD
ncbi:MAG: mevalonate kinase [Atribacterota bacterium]